MFPPKVVGFVGNRGKMFLKIYKRLFTAAGYKVIGSDLSDPLGLSNEEVVRRADVVFFSILPLDGVARAMRALVPFAKSGTLWVDGSSVRQVRGDPIGDDRLVQDLRDRGVDFGFAHFMMAPSMGSLRGQSILLGFSPRMLDPRWESWLEGILLDKKASPSTMTSGEHDTLTEAAQLMPMLLALASGMVWQRRGTNVPEMLKVAGAPARLQAFGAIRSLDAQEIVSAITAEHPSGPSVVRTFAEVFVDLTKWVDGRQVDTIASEMKQARGGIDEDDLGKILSILDWIAQLFGDLNGGAVGFRFTRDQNSLGLLAQTLSYFDKHGVEKTTTWARTEPSDGSVQFFIGVEPDLDDPSVTAAVKEVVDELGAELLEGDLIF